jgi:hypothetical protein
MKKLPKTEKYIRELLAQKYEDWTNDCVIWPYSRTQAGYGIICRGRLGTRITLYPHQLIYNFYHHKENVEDNKIYHHICENKACINPGHIQRLTYIQHKQAHHRYWTPRGFDEVVEMLNDGLSKYKINSLCGIGIHYIQQIIDGEITREMLEKEYIQCY